MAQHAMDTVINKSPAAHFSAVSGLASESATTIGSEDSSECDPLGTVGHQSVSGTDGGHPVRCSENGLDQSPPPTNISNASDQNVEKNSSESAQISSVLLSNNVSLSNNVLPPSNAQHNNVQHSNVQPSNVQPSNVPPSNVQPGNVQLSNAKQSNVQPSNAQPNNVQPSNVHPNKVQYNNVQPKVLPNNMQPLIQPNSIQPQIQPNSIQPQIQPNNIQSQIQPNNIQPQIPSNNLKAKMQPGVILQPTVLLSNNALHSNNNSPIKLVQNSADPSGQKDEERKHYYESNIVNSSRDLTPITSSTSSPLKQSSNDATKQNIESKSNRNCLELKLNEENAKNKKLPIDLAKLYENSAEDDSKETDSLLGNGSPKTSIQTGSSNGKTNGKFNVAKSNLGKNLMRNNMTKSDLVKSDAYRNDNKYQVANNLDKNNVDDKNADIDEDVLNGDLANNSMIRNDIVKNGIVKKDGVKNDVGENYVGKNYVGKNDVTNIDVTNNDIIKNDIFINDTVKNDLSNNDIVKNETSKNNIIKSESPEEERPVLHVQFNSERTNSSSTATVKDPCSSPSSSMSSGSSSSSEDSIELSEARPPDGGWGWVVVAASFVVNLIADGITFSFGVIFVEFLNYFGENRGKTAWIGSLFMAMPLLSGPIASFLTDRYGCRKVTMVGSVLACTGFVISSLANSMEVLFLTFGVLAGFGLSLCYVASVVIVAYYFDKRRSFATGLSVCGSGIGTFIFAPLTQMLLAEYGWRGTTLILAGLFLNLAVCGALMRDLPWTSSRQKSLAKERKRNRSMKRKRNGSSVDTFSVSNSTNTASVLQPILEVNEKEKEEEGGTDRLCSSLVNLPTFVRNGEKVPLEVIELLSTHKNVYNVLMQNYPNLLTPSRSFSDSGRLNEAHLQSHPKFIPIPSPLAVEPAPLPSLPVPPGEEGPPEGQHSSHNNTDATYIWWLKRNQITPPRLNQQKKLPTAYLRDLRVHRLSLTYRGAMLNINRYRLRASSCPDIYRNSMTTIAKEKSEWHAVLWDFWDLLRDMFDFSHFSDPKFLLFSISNFLLYTWYDVPYVYLADNAIEMGFSENDSSMLIGIIGIVNMFGEIILGWAGDRPWINADLVYAVCMALCGAVTALIPLLKNYLALCAVSGAFGLFIAANYSLTCIILVDLLTLEKFTNAYGLLLLVQGVANLIGPPLGGWLCDVTGNYDVSFYMAGFFIALSGLMMVILPATKRYRRFQTLQRQVSSECSIHGDTSPKEPKFHNILASCITGKVEKKEAPPENHV